MLVGFRINIFAFGFSPTEKHNENKIIMGIKIFKKPP
jgi:hypothetical protein